MERETSTAADNYDFGARILDGRLGRWLSVDFLSKASPQMTPYRFGFCNPLRFVDKDGHYEIDGHYFTVYLVCMMIGLSPEYAQALARNTEVWDTKMGVNSAKQNYTWLILKSNKPYMR
jgi:RHS repeat-associated protein